MSELPMHILTDAGFSDAEAQSVVRHLVSGVDLHDGSPETDRLDVESLPQAKKDALEKFTMAVAADA
jgi:hypothetical protein